MLTSISRRPSTLLRGSILLAAALLALYLALLGGLDRGASLQLVLGHVVLVAGALLASGGLWYATRVAGSNQPRLRQAWALLALAQLFAALGNLMSAVADMSGQTVPTLADALYLAYYPLFVLATLLLPTTPTTGADRLRLLLDMAIMLLGAGLVLWTFWLGPEVMLGAARLERLLYALAYPVANTALFFALVVLLLRHHTARRLSLLLLAASALVLVVTNFLFGNEYVQSAATSNGLLDLGWLLSYVCLGLAGVFQAADVPGWAEPQETRARQRSRWLILLLPYVVLAAAYWLLLWGRNQQLIISYPALGVVVGGIMLLVLARQVLATYENRRLLQAETRRREADAVLLGLSRQLLSAPDEAAIGRGVVQVAAEALQSDVALLVLRDADGRLRPGASHGWLHGPAEDLAFEPGAGSQAGFTLEHGQPVRVADYSAPRAFQAPEAQRQGAVSGASVPLLIDSRTIGVVAVFNRTSRDYGEADVRLLTLIANQAAAAIDRIRLFEVRRRQVDELTVLRAVAAAGADAVNEDELIGHVTDIVASQLYGSNLGVLLLDRQTGLLESHPSYHGDNSFSTRLGQGITGHVALTGQPARVDDVSVDPRYLAQEPGIRSELCVPMLVGDQVIGVLNVESDRPRAFGEDDERLVTTIARQLATALEKLRLFERLFQAEQQRAGELEAVRQASLGLTASLDLQAVLRAILQSVMRLVPNAQEAFVFLYHSDGGGRLTFGASRSRLHEATMPDEWAPRSDGLTLTVARSGEMVMVSDIRQHALFGDARPGWEGAIIGLPLKIGARVVGVMNVTYPAPRVFPDSELRVLRLLGDQASIAIENARLFQAERAAREQAEALREVAGTLNASLDRQQLLKLILEQLARVVGFDSASVMLFDAGQLHIVARSGFRPNTLHNLPSSAGPLRHLTEVIETRRPLIIADTAADRRWYPLPGSEYIRCWLGVPLVAQNRAIGLLNLDHEQPGRYTDRDAELATVFANQAAVAIENARLFEAERRQLALAQTLQAVGALLTSQMGLEEVFQNIFDLLAQVVDYDSVSVQLLAPDGRMELAAGRGFADMQAARENVRYVSEQRRVDQWLQNRVMVMPDVQNDPRWIPSGGAEYVRSWIGAALVVKGKLVGILTTESATPYAYTSATGETVQAFANQAAVAIENARLFEASQRQTQALAGLYNTALATGSVLEPDMLLTRFFEQVRGLLDPDSFMVAFYHADSDELEVVSAVEAGRPTEDLLPLGRLPVSQGLTGWVTRQRRSLVVDDLHSDPLPVPPRFGIRPARSWLGVPLIARDRNLGVVAVESLHPGAFDSADQRFLESIASQVAIAIENARLYSEVSARANELSRLYAAAQDLGARLEPRAVLEQLAKHLTEAVDATSGFVVEVNLTSELLTVLAEYCTAGATAEERASSLGKVRSLADHPTIARAINRLSVMEMQAESGKLTDFEQESLRRVGVKSALVVPIVARGEVLGEAEIWESRRVRVFSLAERRLLQTLCQHAAGVIENARLFAETLQHADEVTTASEILHLLNATANVIESFPLIAAAIKSITGCERVSMAMLDSQHSKVTMVAIDRARAELPRGVQFPVSFTAASTDVLAGHIHLTPDLEAELAYPAERQLYEAGFRSRLNLPLRVGTQVIGSLNLVWREVSGYMQANLPLLTQLVDAIALAVEKTRLFDETRRRDAILEALAYASGALLMPGEPSTVMPNLLAQLGRAAGVSRASIFFNEPGEEGTVWASLRHEWIAPGQTSKADDPDWRRFPYGGGGFLRWQEMLSAGRTLDGLVRDFPPSERLRLERQSVLSVAAVPILSEGEWWGWLGFDDCQGERIWSGAEIEALKSVAGALGAYLARQRIETAEQEQRALAEALRDAAAVLSSTLDLDEVLDRILTDVGHVVPHESANILLVEEGVARVVRNRDAGGRVAQDLVLAHRFAVEAIPNLRHMLETGQPSIILDTRNYPGWLDTADTRWIRSSVGAPIQIKGQVIGFITLDNDTPGFFSLAHAERLQAFAQQAGLAIENAQLYASIRRHAEELEQRVEERTRELAAANERLQELDRLKDQIISNVSHELRTPLTNIKLHLGLLEKRGAEVLGRYLPTLQRETERLRRLIEDLLDLSRLQTQPQTLRRDHHPLDDLLSEVLTVHAARAEAKGLALRHEPGATPLVVPVDRAQIIQVFTNLIGNAVAYTPSGGTAVVSSALTRVGSTPGVSVIFHNDGPAIPPEDLPYLFRPFYRGRTAQESGEPGTGLGLAICKEIIERHGGQIEVTSSVADGTTFVVWLPLS